MDAGPKPGSQPDHLSRYVRRTFRHTLRGYNPAEVDEHLQRVKGWFTLAGFEQLLADHRDEIFASALEEADATVERARRESEAMMEKARRDSEAMLEEARRNAQAISEAAEQRLMALKEIALDILDEAGAQD